MVLLKRIVIKGFAVLMYYTGGMRLFTSWANSLQSASAFPYLKRRASPTVQILIYHRINDEYDPFFPATPVQQFQQQMEFLAERYRLLSLAEAVDRLRAKEVPANAVVITFDDGYRDNYLNAFPILKKLSIPATVFLATGAIGSGKMLWHDRVFAAFRRTKEPELVCNGCPSIRHSLLTTQAKLKAQHDVLEFLWGLADREREAYLSQLEVQLKVFPEPDSRPLMLTWDEVRLMRDGGVSFGANTVAHPILSRLSTDKARVEVLQSKRAIEAELHTAVSAFAYPVGRSQDFSEETKAIIREAGFSCAVTTIGGGNGPGQDLYALRRATPWDQDIKSFGLRLGCYKWAS